MHSENDESDGDDIDDDYVKVECDEGDFSTLPQVQARGLASLGNLRPGMCFAAASLPLRVPAVSCAAAARAARAWFIEPRCPSWDPADAVCPVRVVVTFFTVTGVDVSRFSLRGVYGGARIAAATDDSGYSTAVDAGPFAWTDAGESDGTVIAFGRRGARSAVYLNVDGDACSGGEVRVEVCVALGGSVLGTATLFAPLDAPSSPSRTSSTAPPASRTPAVESIPPSAAFCVQARVSTRF